MFQKHALLLIKQIADVEKRIDVRDPDLVDALTNVSEKIAKVIGVATVDDARNCLDPDREKEILVSLSQVIGDMRFAQAETINGNTESLKRTAELMKNRIN
jgi:hypothetical protein